MKDDQNRHQERQARRIPMEFNIFDSGIAETVDKPIFCLSNDEPSESYVGINLHAGPFDLHPKIANLTHRIMVWPGWETMKTMEVVLFETTEETQSCKVILEQRKQTGDIWDLFGRLLWWRASAIQWVFTMRVPLRGGLTDIDFEWRHSRGAMIRRLREADGWMLWKKRTPDEMRKMADERDELVALVSRGSRPDLGTRFEFVNSAAYGELGNQFSVVAIMSGIGVILAQKKSLGDCVDALEITTRRRRMLMKAALAEKHARDAKDWLNTMELMEDWKREEKNRSRPSQSDRIRACVEEQAHNNSRPFGTRLPEPPIARLRRGFQLSDSSMSATTPRARSAKTRDTALTPSRRTASNRSRRYEQESDRYVRSQGCPRID